MKYFKVDIKVFEESLDPVFGWLTDLGVVSMQIEDGRDLEEILDKKKGYEYDHVSDELMAEHEEHEGHKCHCHEDDDQCCHGEGHDDPNHVCHCHDDDDQCCHGEGHDDPNHECHCHDHDHNHSHTLVNLIIYLSPEEDEVLNDIFTHKNTGFGKPSDWIRDMSIGVVDDSSWKDSYKKHFKTIPLCKDIVMVPSWEKDDFNSKDWDNRKPIYMDPGMAFGTGTHPTTSMCAEFMDEYGVDGKSVLDVGTGTGILAIVAEKLGANEIFGIDIDPEAVAIAKENIAKNSENSIIKVEVGDLLKGIDFKADVVVANLIAEAVLDLATSVKNNLEDGGIMICSGILKAKKEMVEKGLKEKGFEIIKTKEIRDWCAMVVKVK